MGLDARRDAGASLGIESEARAGRSALGFAVAYGVQTSSRFQTTEPIFGI